MLSPVIKQRKHTTEVVEHKFDFNFVIVYS
jgi:hypothetical protein